MQDSSTSTLSPSEPTSPTEHFALQLACHANFVSYAILLILFIALTLSMLLGIKSFALYTVIFLLFGVVQGALHNILAAVLTRKFTTSEDGCLMGLWAVATSIGNILNLLVFTVMIYDMKLDWKWYLMVAPVLSFIVAGLLKLFEEELQQEYSN